MRICLVIGVAGLCLSLVCTAATAVTPIDVAHLVRVSAIVENETAVEDLLWLAEGGDRDAQVTLANRYLQGRGVQANHAEALKWYHRAAEQGDVTSQALLGSVYRYGDGVKKNYAEALRWLRKAAEQGDAGAQSNLGQMYKKGQGVPQNYSSHLYTYYDAAEQ